MAKNVFISFRYKDGHAYKERLSSLFDAYYDTVDYSEDINRSNMTEFTIKQHLYKKLRKSSITIVLLTPEAINHKKNYLGNYDDWMYDEIRYSLEQREGNRTNGLIAVYTPEAARYLVEETSSGSVIVKDVDNLFRKNMMNVKPQFKVNPNPRTFDSNFDSYCSLISWKNFLINPSKYIDIATSKRNAIYKYDICRRL